jgi:hypothetical protein
MVIALFTIVVDDKVISRIDEQCQFSAKRLEGLLRYAGVIRFFFLIGHVHLIGVWFSEDHITNIIKIHV